MERPIQDASTHSDLTHFNDEGRAQMVDISDKSETERVACAAGTVHLNEDTHLFREFFTHPGRAAKHFIEVRP